MHKVFLYMHIYIYTYIYTPYLCVSKRICNPIRRTDTHNNYIIVGVIFIYIYIHVYMVTGEKPPDKSPPVKS